MIPDLVARECYKFAIEVTETTFDLYSSRQDNKNKDQIINQHFIAKITEWYVWFYLVDKNYIVSTPDMKVYPKNNKSFDADLYVIGRNVNIHVKTLNIYLNSVLFQKDEVKNFKENDYICIVKYVNMKKIQIISFKKALDYIYLEPKKNMPSKVAIYL